MDDKPTKIKVPFSRLEIVMEILALAGLLLILSIIFFNWGGLPETIPTHFGVSGIADGFGDRWTILLIPGIATLLYLTITIISRFPHLYNYPWPITTENAPRQYGIFRRLVIILKAEAMYLMGYIEWGIVEVANGRQTGLNVFFLPVVAITVIGTIGFHIYQGYKAR